MKRRTGPAPKPYHLLSRKGKRDRDQARAGVKHIIVGTGVGRAGTSSMARNLQAAGARVTHEASNVHSTDYIAARPDKFFFQWDAEKRQSYVENQLRGMVDRAGGCSIVGDISWVHAPLMADYLLADQRVTVLVQIRSPKPWVHSVMSNCRGGRAEMNMLRNFGISAATHGDREKRLLAYLQQVTRAAERLKTKFHRRVLIIELSELNVMGGALLRALDLESTWDSTIANASAVRARCCLGLHSVRHPTLGQSTECRHRNEAEMRKGDSLPKRRKEEADSRVKGQPARQIEGQDRATKRIRIGGPIATTGASVSSSFHTAHAMDPLRSTPGVTAKGVRAKRGGNQQRAWTACYTPSSRSVKAIQSAPVTSAWQSGTCDTASAAGREFQSWWSMSSKLFSQFFSIDRTRTVVG